MPIGGNHPSQDALSLDEKEDPSQQYKHAKEYRPSGQYSGYCGRDENLARQLLDERCCVRDEMCIRDRHM